MQRWAPVRYGPAAVVDRNAALRQMLHQVQVKRQLLESEALKQGQHVATLVGIDKIVGIFDATGTGFDMLQLTQSKRLQKRGGLGERDFGVNGHARNCKTRDEVRAAQARN